MFLGEAVADRERRRCSPFEKTSEATAASRAGTMTDVGPTDAAEDSDTKTRHGRGHRLANTQVARSLH
jgi:hypothetical protein